MFKHFRRDFFASTIGNVIEWYDYLLFAYLAVLFGREFFPLNDGSKSLMYALGIWGAGNLMRPLGGLIFGHIGDKYSVKRALQITLIFMGSCTALMGCLPTYHMIGHWAPILLLCIRLLQGVAVGGEFPGSLLTLKDIAPQKNSIFFISLSYVGAFFGLLLASATIAVLLFATTKQFFYQWGWRIPFWSSIILVFFGYYLRIKMWEGRSLDSAHMNTIPMVKLFHTQKKNLLLVLGVILFLAAYKGLNGIFKIPYLYHYLHFSLKNANYVMMLSLVVQLITFPLSAYIADKVKNLKHYLMVLSIICILVAFPSFYLVTKGHLGVIIGICFFDIVFGFIICPLVFITLDVFPKHVRYSGFAFCYGVGMSVFGSFIPLSLNALVLDHGVVAPALIFIITTAIVMVCLWRLFKKSAL